MRALWWQLCDVLVVGSVVQTLLLAPVIPLYKQLEDLGLGQGGKHGNSNNNNNNNNNNTSDGDTAWGDTTMISFDNTHHS